MSNHKTFDSNILSQFTGTEEYYRYGLKGEILLTQGAKYVADSAGAYWLMDEICLAQRFNKLVLAEEFQLWILSVAANKTAKLKCDDGNGRIVYTKHISFTDFPVIELKLYYVNSVIMLPSEY